MFPSTTRHPVEIWKKLSAMFQQEFTQILDKASGTCAFDIKNKIMGISFQSLPSNLAFQIFSTVILIFFKCFVSSTDAQFPHVVLLSCLSLIAKDLLNCLNVIPLFCSLKLTQKVSMVMIVGVEVFLRLLLLLCGRYVKRLLMVYLTIYGLILLLNHPSQDEKTLIICLTMIISQIILFIRQFDTLLSLVI